MDIVTSFLVEAEITRELVSAHGLKATEVAKTWKDFVKAYKCRYIEKFEFDRNLVKLVAKSKLRLRTMFNFQHLFIAMKEDAYFVSGDKDITRKTKELGIYDKVVSYIELRKMLSSTS